MTHPIQVPPPGYTLGREWTQGLTKYYALYRTEPAPIPAGRLMYIAAVQVITDGKPSQVLEIAIERSWDAEGAIAAARSVLSGYLGLMRATDG
jgi:hypothetical protein